MKQIKEFPDDFKGDRTEYQTCFNCEKKKNILEFIKIKIPNKKYHDGGWTYNRSVRKDLSRYRCNECNNIQTEFIRCNKCTELKHRDEFGKQDRPTGKKVNCKPCSMSEWSKNRKKNIDKYRKNEKEREKRYELKNIPRTWARRLTDNARSRSKKNGIIFNITRDDILFKLNNNSDEKNWPICEVTKIPFIHYRYDPKKEENRNHGQNLHNAFAPSLDRIIPENGYTFENTRVVVNIFNNARGKAKDQNIKRLLRAVINKENNQVSEIKFNHIRTIKRITKENINLQNYFNNKIYGLRSMYRDWSDVIDLDFDWFLSEVENNTCKVTGIPYLITIGSNGISEDNDWSPSIDKINPYGGYLKKNCRVVNSLYNRTKNIWKDEEVKILAEKCLEQNYI